MIKKFKEHSHIPIKEIEKQQRRHRLDLLQPRLSDGTLNPEFLKHYGAKNIRLTIVDVMNMRKKNPKYAKQLAVILEKQKTEERWNL